MGERERERDGGRADAPASGDDSVAKDDEEEVLRQRRCETKQRSEETLDHQAFTHWKEADGPSDSKPVCSQGRGKVFVSLFFLFFFFFFFSCCFGGKPRRRGGLR